MESEVKFRVECFPEDESPEGQFEEAEQVAFVRKLAQETEWGWCWVRVTAYIEGIDLRGTDTLGGCCYESQKDFEKGGYFEDMKSEARRDLFQKIWAVKELPL